MKSIIDSEQLERLRKQAQIVDKLLIESSGTNIKLVAQIGFLLGMINATNFTEKKILGCEIPF